MEKKRLNYFQANKNKKPKKIKTFICPKKIELAYIELLKEIEKWKS